MGGSKRTRTLCESFCKLLLLSILNALNLDTAAHLDYRILEDVLEVLLHLWELIAKEPYHHFVDLERDNG